MPFGGDVRDSGASGPWTARREFVRQVGPRPRLSVAEAAAPSQADDVTLRV